MPAGDGGMTEMLIVALLLQAGAPVCRTLEVPQSDGSTVPTPMCRAPDGSWRPAAADSGRQGAIPQRAEITYQGTYDVTVSQPMRVPRKFSLESALDAVQGSRGRTLSGTLTIVAKFEGQAVTAQASGTGGVRAARMSGSSIAGRCHLALADGSTTYDGTCTSQGFTGTIGGTAAGNSTVRGRFTLAASKVVDVAERERQQQFAAEKARIDREKAIAAERARIAAMPNAGAAYTTKLAGLVQADARGWAFNHLDPGSVHNVKVADGSIKSGNFVLRGEYTYNGGSPGSVLAQFSAGKFACIQFWDAMIGCRGLRTVEQGQTMRSLALGAVSGGGGGGGSSQPDESSRDAADAADRGFREQMRQMNQPAPEPAPVTPIGGDRGLYGSDHSCCERR